MKPVAFELERAGSLEEACRLLARGGDDAKVLAGGQSLVPLLNFRLARPELLVDLNPVRELRYVERDDGTLRIGAMARQREVERSPELAGGWQLLAETLPMVAHPPIRNRGTVVGSIAHADAAAELCAVSLALDATVLARSERGGEREIAIDDFFLGPFTTALEPDEVLVEVRLPAQPAGAGSAFLEIARRRGDFAIAGVAAVLDAEPGGTVRDARLAFASMGPQAMRARRAEAALRGMPATEATFREAAEAAVSELEPVADLHATLAYRRHVAAVLCRRALSSALARSAAGAAGA